MFWLWEFQALNLVIKSLVMKLKPHLGTATTPVKDKKRKKEKKRIKSTSPCVLAQVRIITFLLRNVLTNDHTFICALKRYF